MDEVITILEMVEGVEDVDTRLLLQRTPVPVTWLRRSPRTHRSRDRCCGYPCHARVAPLVHPPPSSQTLSRSDQKPCRSTLHAPADNQFKVALHADSFHSYRCDAPEPEMETSKDELIDLYQKMVRSLCLPGKVGADGRCP